MAVITISRQYGSGGDEIAQRVCESLGYRRFDKDLMAQVASDVGLSEGEIVDLSEASFKSQSILSRLLSLLTTPTGETPTVTQTSTWQRDTSGAKVKQIEQVSEARVVAIVGQTIQAAYKLGDIVIVGRGGQAVLRDKPGVLHVRIEAPLDTRIQRVVSQTGANRSEAEKQIHEHDKSSAGYIKRFYNADWDDTALYHLVVTAGLWGVDRAARVVVDAARQISDA